MNTKLSAAHVEHARQVADAILYEGYLLYPYRQSAAKNQVRFQFGVLMPPGYEEVDDSEPSWCQTECLLDCADDADVQVLVRFLQLQRRTVEVRTGESGGLRAVAELDIDGTRYTSFDEAVEREVRVSASVSSLLAGEVRSDVRAGGGESIQELTDWGGLLAGQVVRRWHGLDGTLTLRAERLAGPYRTLRLHLRLENVTQPPKLLHSRQDGLACALIAAHLLVGVPGGAFVSMTDPPEWAAAEVAACRNIRAWPVLAGPQPCRDLLLSAPVILYDHPEVAAESAGDLFDATEIDEILTLRTLALTDDEKRQARATDGRAADLLERLEDLPPELVDRMHGAIRYLGKAKDGREPEAGRAGAGRAGAGRRAVGYPAGSRPEPSRPAGLDRRPDSDHVLVGGVRVARGSRVVMRPGARRADAQDVFLAGRDGVVEEVLFDVDGRVHLAVTPADDPAADLSRSQGRFLYFAPDEVVPCETEAGVPELAAGELAGPELAAGEPAAGELAAPEVAEGVER